ncbi:hypothetical protein WN55_03254 [Dufourea novaeangliae]|uniref:Uncharacterized protein n=1 Tax=Dufourea novaeangliae TaxID=178035 RepID=A0A154PK21_DUFNO|nr:hypothetical protein WN55_03254 [Dufourea novaeangliae]
MEEETKARWDRKREKTKLGRELGGNGATKVNGGAKSATDRATGEKPNYYIYGLLIRSQAPFVETTIRIVPDETQTVQRNTESETPREEENPVAPQHGCPVAFSRRMLKALRLPWQPTTTAARWLVQKWLLIHLRLRGRELAKTEIPNGHIVYPCRFSVSNVTKGPSMSGERRDREGGSTYAK